VTCVLLLGVSGMLGGMVARVLEADPEVELVGTARDPGLPARFPIERFDALRDDPTTLLQAVEPDWVVNAIGLTKPRVDSEDHAVAVNARFPAALAEAAEAAGARVVQIATDGVFSGRSGGYREDAPHDALDAYGRSKSLGEVVGITHLRCSIVGPDGGSGSLMEWLLSQPRGATVPGYSDHVWNGVTTPAFGRICAGIVREGLELPSPLHVVPADSVTKADLLALIARACGRDDLIVEPQPSGEPVDRTLATLHPEANAALWRAAGYGEPPTIAAMVEELGRRMI
jgi:dTDP-4-dehydrorhamnose reductase